MEQNSLTLKLLLSRRNLQEEAMDILIIDSRNYLQEVMTSLLEEMSEDPNDKEMVGLLVEPETEIKNFNKDARKRWVTDLGVIYLRTQIC